MDVLQAKVASLMHQNDRLLSRYESLRDGQRLFEQFCRGQFGGSGAGSEQQEAPWCTGLQDRVKESLEDPKDRITLELGMAALPPFSLSRRLGSGMAVPDDKHAIFQASRDSCTA